MDKPLIFISHKTDDSDIAIAVARFIRDSSQGKVDVFLSSDWTFEGPRVGGDLYKELTSALWNSDALILIYTSAEQDWSYCMWECGVATHPKSPDTRIVVFQCGLDVPTPFAHDLRVNVRRQDDILKFTKQLLKAPDFFPGLSNALAPDIAQETVAKAAQELFDSLASVIRDPPPLREWAAWPFLRLELSQPEVEKLVKLEDMNRTERMKLAHEIVKESGIVVECPPRTLQLFGLTGGSDNFKFNELLRVWKQKFPTMDATWFDSCCEQIRVGAERKFPVIWQNSLREVSGEADYTPVLSRVKYVPFSESVQFDFYFYNLSDPQAVLATSRMIPKGKFFFKDLGQNPPETIKLRELVDELRPSGLNRIPVLNGEGQPLYIVHRSMIDKFVAENVWGKSGVSPDNFTLADLLAEPEMKGIFENTFVVVNQQCTLAEAKSAMLARPGCSDIFVTEHGRRDEKVIGWLTNVDIARNN